MSIEAQTVLDRILPHRTPACEQAEAFAPANIALCKYWGKRNDALKLPLTGSLSISLGELGTRMRIQLATEDRLIINGQEQPPEEKAFQRLFAHLQPFRDPDTHFEIHSENTIPMAAGLASSASAFAAAALCLNRLYDWQLTGAQLSILARLGSGSASRSVYRGFVEWQCGEKADGMDSFAIPLETLWPAFRVGILTLSGAEKKVGSGAGMKQTVETSMLYQSWPAQVARDLPLIREGVLHQDFDQVGRYAEQNAMAMHATMIAGWPGLIYWQPQSVAVLHQVQELRESGIPVYATMDAGPNVKLLFLQDQEADLKAAFPDLQVIQPFGA